MTQIKKIGFASLAVATAVQSTYAAINFQGTSTDGGIQTGIKGSEENADQTIQTLVSNAMLFIGILAVLYGIYGGFLILTAGGKEDGVKKGKTIIFQSVLGIIVIFLANSIVQWLLTAILTKGSTN